MIKLGTTSEKKKNIAVFFIFLCKQFWEKDFQKIKYHLEIPSKNDNSRYKYFHVIKLGTTSERKKNITVFFIFLCKKFWEKDFQKIKYQLEISSKNDNSRYYYFRRKKLGIKSKLNPNLKKKDLEIVWSRNIWKKILIHTDKPEYSLWRTVLRCGHKFILRCGEFFLTTAAAFIIR